MATPQIIKQAAQFLRSNMTDAEKILWEEMRSDRLN